ncbi:hexokinase family protein [Propionispora vibrioides]|uniref:Hexokinase n=1 Tax=Propionispora vibrioides TaxID=112903 RepID=A0A1H8V6T5_9FIRM|nr:hexokinase [Propionispora vibrioides]SEP11071.1 hexokinase [Propionispora vibrioides]
MQSLETTLQQATRDLTVSLEQIHAIAKSFKQAMIDGMAGTDETLKMLPSFLQAPTGRETGQYLAVDFGGTNVRTLVAELDGKGGLSVKNHLSRPLKDPSGAYDYLAASASAEELFDFIAEQLAQIAEPSVTYHLGHTFSFPMRQTGVNTASLIHWTKEIATAGVESQDVNQLLQAALHRKGLTNIKPQVILNDTVGTLLTSAYSHPGTDIGSICGTGHNTAYLEPKSPLTGGPMVINMESGNFNKKLPLSNYDRQLDQSSEKPGAQLLEKMVSGRYIGELLQLIMTDLQKKGLLSHCADKVTAFLSQPACFSGADIAVLTGDASGDLTAIAAWLKQRLCITDSALSDRQALATIATLIATRSARLVAASFVGILQRIDPALEHNHTIAIDGSLYEKLPGYADAIHQVLAEVYRDRAHRIVTKLSKDGSGLGAVVAVAIASRS